MTGDNGDPVNFLDLVRHIRESAIVVWNEMDVNKNGYIDYKGNLLKGIGSLSSVRFKSISRIINHVTRDWFPKFANGLNIKIGIVHKVCI